MSQFATFLTHTEIWENFSLKPPKIWQFISEKSEKKPWISKILTYKCLNFLTFLTHTEIWENFSLKPPKIWQFISEKSEIIPKHFENLTYKSLYFLNILIWTPLQSIFNRAWRMFFIGW